MAEIAPYSTATTDVRHNPYLATGTGVFLCPDCGQQVVMLRNLGDRWVCQCCYGVARLRLAQHPPEGN